MEYTLTFMPESQQSRNGEEEEEEGQWLGKVNFQNITKTDHIYVNHQVFHLLWVAEIGAPLKDLQQYVNRELHDVQAGLRKGRGIRDKIANICWITGFDCVDHNKLWKILQEMGIPDHLTCLLRNLNAG